MKQINLNIHLIQYKDYIFAFVPEDCKDLDVNLLWMIEQLNIYVYNKVFSLYFKISKQAKYSSLPAQWNFKYKILYF